MPIVLFGKIAFAGEFGFVPTGTPYHIDFNQQVAFVVIVAGNLTMLTQNLV